MSVRFGVGTMMAPLLVVGDREIPSSESASLPELGSDCESTSLKVRFSGRGLSWRDDEDKDEEESSTAEFSAGFGVE